MKLKMMDPKEIIAIIVLLMILAVGVFAFFVTTNTMKNTIATPRGNYGTLSTNRTIRTTQTNPTFINVSSSFSNVTSAVQLDAWNTTTSSWVTIQAVGAANGTFISGNNTYRVVKRSVAGEVKWHYYRIKYSVVGAYTPTLTNQSYKAQSNESSVGGTVFNIIGIMITISAIFSIVAVLYVYMRPKK